MKGLPAAFSRHIRFYSALACGIAAWLICRLFSFEAAPLAGGVTFYLVFLGFCAALLGQKTADLKKRAKREDEGIAVVLLITLATMGFFCLAVFTALHDKQHIDILPLVLAAIGAPLGWCVLHTVMAFHYADIYYFDDAERDLDFPGRGDPGTWDFLYFSFVIGMTAQVSDVVVKTTVMRRSVLWHGVVSFFFNTVFIAMVVNAGVTLAS